jgi:hypothetical protein
MSDAAADRPSESMPADRRTSTWWPIAWYPVAIPIAFSITLWSAYSIHPIWLVRSVVLAIFFVGLIAAVLGKLLADRNRAALATFFLAFALVLVDSRITLLVLVVAAGVVISGLVRRGNPWRVGPLFTRILSAISIVLLVVIALGTIRDGTAQTAVDDIARDLSKPTFVSAFDPAAPDIYVVLLDGYPGDDAASIDPEFDANAFPEALASRGFDVERGARSNYLLTRMTVATMLADEHLNAATGLAPPFGPLVRDNRRLQRLTDDGIVYASLRAAGYESITLSSPAVHLGLRMVNRVIDQPGPTEFELSLLKATSVGRDLDGLAPDTFAAMARDQIVSTFASAESVAAEPHARPRFVWIHVLAPHPPFLFHGDGTPMTNSPVLGTAFADPTAAGGRAARIEETFDYAEFIWRRTIQLLDQMLASASRESVIVVFSDHGTETGFDSTNPLASDLNERSSIVLAVRSPGHPSLLPRGTTPIGILPRVLNTYLGTSLPIRSDTTWAWRAGGSVLDVVPVDTGNFHR